MAFWNKNALPPEIRDLPAEEIAKRLKAADEAATELTKVRADLTTKDGEISTLQGKVTSLEERINAAPPKADDDDDTPAPVAGGPPTLADWLADPQKAFNQAAAPLTAATLATGSMTAQMAAADYVTKQDPVNRRLWKKFEPDVIALVNKLPAEQRIFPQTWINQFTFVKGIRLSDIVKEAQGQGDAFFSETSTPGGGGIISPTPEQKLSPMEEKVARAMKMDPKKYLERKQLLAKQQTPNA